MGPVHPPTAGSALASPCLTLPCQPCCAGHSSHTARTLSQVCSSWRQGVAAERSALRQLRFSRLEPRAAGSCGNGSSQASSALSGAGAERSSSSGGFQLPWLVEQAVKAGNVAASVAAARYLERQGQDGVLPQSTPGSAAALRAAGTWYGAESEAAALRRGAGAAAARSSGMAAQAARYWARAAKAGHPEAQWKLGLGHYKVCTAWPGRLGCQLGSGAPPLSLSWCADRRLLACRASWASPTTARRR